MDAVEVLQDMMLEDEVWGRGFVGTHTGLGWDGGEELGFVGGHTALGWDGGEEVGLVGGHTALVLDDGGEVVLEGTGWALACGTLALVHGKERAEGRVPLPGP